ncbi:MAG: hydrogenase nickel incorporation protein HypB [Lachnospiraceae bacterium]|jgi:hydrogenase nickel incorporation protein HypB|nr:hydrogenase nickel incorporation protein HypB [Lachnospiraceae bacterium]MCI7329301.1 hydrogenase nickel incorporation protein HypB [Lachnospiraceae bacterium]MDD7701982.1 hydrogenase nickel incorporation protein HypB [Lachnospiraceae bacterium]MDY3301860.1 hydrogenase nickel incorporation protein HypB [Lachnospiraceae bacterium]
MKVIELNASVTDSNDRDADQLRQDTKDQGTLIVNIMSSPGSGKTTLLSRVITDMKEKISIGVMEADIASDVDAIKIQNLGAESIQAHTDGMCHMDAGMTRRALEAMDNNRLDLIFLENVGNLICPAEFDTGAGKDVMILSIPEGDDKPLKYPLMFSTSHALVITKVDALPYFDFDMDKCVCRVKRLNPDIKIFPVSAKTGEGMEAFENWLFEAQAEWKNESLIQ